MLLLCQVAFPSRPQSRPSLATALLLCCRGDAAKLPQQVLDLCEIEPLRQEEAGSTRWVPAWTSSAHANRASVSQPKRASHRMTWRSCFVLLSCVAAS